MLSIDIASMPPTLLSANIVTQKHYFIGLSLFPLRDFRTERHIIRRDRTPPARRVASQFRLFCRVSFRGYGAGHCTTQLT